MPERPSSGGRAEWGGDVAPLPPLFETGALRRVMQDAAWRRELEAKLEALGLHLEELDFEPR